MKISIFFLLLFQDPFPSIPPAGLPKKDLITHSEFSSHRKQWETLTWEWKSKADSCRPYASIDNAPVNVEWSGGRNGMAKLILHGKNVRANVTCYGEGGMDWREVEFSVQQGN